MSVTSDDLMPDAAKVYSDRQRLFLLYFVGMLIDLVVLGLFDEYSGKVFVESFTDHAVGRDPAPAAAEGDDRRRA